jgi:SAM-dependent methyltransferase
MNGSRVVGRSVLTLCLLAVAVVGFAQSDAPKQQFQPQVGQRGKDVVWVPSPQMLVEKMLDMAEVTPQDLVMDLGSGDGRTVITAAKRGAKAVGVEFNPDMVELSKQNAAKEGVTGKAEFLQGDLFEADLSKATVITMFLLPDINLRLRPKILDLKPGTRIVSNTFTMEDWVPDETATVGGDCSSWCTALLWIVPAKVDGAWRLPKGDLTLSQQFQMVTGTLKNGTDSVAVTDGRLHGDQLTFTAGGTSYTGRVNGATMELVAKGAGANGKVTATREPK